MTAHADHPDTDQHHDDAPSHGTRRDYVVGFVLAVILTAIPFWLVMSGSGSKQFTSLLVMAFALVQIVVHMVYFLHMNSKSESGWTMMAMIFTVVIIGIALSGSLWVMFHLTTNMMPMSPDVMKQMP
ncbi:cytochrome o ubiquinol oxidase subunit IV [soil metagenome]